MKSLINTGRRRDSSAEHSLLLAATQSDRARLIYSAAFRRLQQKAQVFSLESNSSVRSRLTHSVEVSHIGRYLVASVFEKIRSSENFDPESKQFWMDESLSISNIVEAACLMHDIGNPPFGHFGESAIVVWSKSDEIKQAVKKSLNKELNTHELNDLLHDFHHFDGNPQGLRVITRLQGEDGYYGLNLTYTQLVVFLKYAYCPIDRNEKKPFSKKIGYFCSEESIVMAAWQALGMRPNTRHPLGFLMEASDDISYCISDIEDGIEKKIITFETFREFTLKRIEYLIKEFNDHISICEDLITCLSKSKKSPIGEFLTFKVKLSNYLVDKVSSRFVENYELLIKCDYNQELISKNDFEYKLLKILKDFSSQYIFASEETEKMELSGFPIIKGILDEYLKLLSMPKVEFTFLVMQDNDKIKELSLHIQRRLFNRLPIKHLNAYKTALLSLPTNDIDYTSNKLSTTLHDIDELKEWKLRTHLIVDFVSGMTDQFAMDTYHMLKGIKVMQ